MDYQFFDDGLRDRFMAQVAQRNVSASMRPDSMEGFVVTLPDDLNDETLEAIEEDYDRLMDEQIVLAGQQDALLSRQLAGVTVTLSDGTQRTVRLPGPVAGRLLAHFAPDEVHEIVTAIARSLENPVDAPLCRDG